MFEININDHVLVNGIMFTVARIYGIYSYFFLFKAHILDM